jgi:hypothetical protein
MRKVLLPVLGAFFLAGCDKPESKVSAPPPPPAVQAPIAAAKAVEPPPAPQPSASELLAARIKALLRDAKGLEAQGVDVKVADGVVTLYGTAPTPEDRQRIAALVAKLDGVRSVVNNLVVIRGS